MNIFALDASSNITSLALQTLSNSMQKLNLDNYFESDNQNKSHSEEINTRFKELILKADFNIKDLDLLLVGCGPGSYTGLRISYAFIKGLASSLKIPVFPISPYSACAFYELFINPEVQNVDITADARRKEIYIASFNRKTTFTKQPEIKMIEVEGYLKRENNIRHITFSPELFTGLNRVSCIAPKLIHFYANNLRQKHQFSIDSISEIKPSYIRGVNAKTIAERELEKA